MEYFPGLTSLEILQKIQEDLQDQNIQPEHFEGRIIFMSMFNDIDWTKRRHSDVFQIPKKLRSTRRDSHEDTGHSSAVETKRNGTELSTVHLKENEIPSPQRWWDISKKLVTQYSRASVLLSREILKRKGGRCTLHFDADSSNTELLLRTIHSANQLSIYGAVSSWCEEFAQRTPNRKERLWRSPWQKKMSSY